MQVSGIRCQVLYVMCLYTYFFSKCIVSGVGCQVVYQELEDGRQATSFEPRMRWQVAGGRWQVPGPGLEGGGEHYVHGQAAGGEGLPQHQGLHLGRGQVTGGR